MIDRRSPPAGSSGPCPQVNNNGPLRTPWESGGALPSGQGMKGARSVRMASRRRGRRAG
ncbi:hypothetical protein GCM10022403_063200 [Streptomyces coacervatus]|uniref:Uncharacterized protein n=1 Tax=Streptomyces coacervatus TaxID=647381 RepID=A0ABP7IKX0_9ACTN